jgi:hypothetical protein
MHCSVVELHSRTQYVKTSTALRSRLTSAKVAVHQYRVSWPATAVLLPQESTSCCGKSTMSIIASEEGIAVPWLEQSSIACKPELMTAADGNAATR